MQIKKLKKANLNILKRLFKISNAAFANFSSWSMESFVASLNDRNTQCLLLMENEEIIGFLLYKIILNEADIINVAILPVHQSRGYGRKLLNAALDKIFVQGVDTVFLEVRNSNLLAQKLYQSFNFKILTARQDYYSYPKEDAVVMSLSLDNWSEEGNDLF